MALTGIFEVLTPLPAWRKASEALASGRAAATSVIDAARPVLLAALWQATGGRRPLVVVAPRPDDARRLRDALEVYLGDDAPVHLLPEAEALPFERLVADAGTTIQRIRVLSALALPRADGEPAPLVVASLAGALRRVPERGRFSDACTVVRTGQRLRLEETVARWVALGYQVEPNVEIPGTVSRRGGILDVFSPADDSPVRIELWGDQVEAVRRFDPMTQRSTAKVDSALVVPAREVLPALSNREVVQGRMEALDFSNVTEAARERFRSEVAALFAGEDLEEVPFYAGLLNDASLLSYMGDDAALALVDPNGLATEALELEEHAFDLRRAKEERGDIPVGFPSPFLRWRDFHAEADARPRRWVLSPVHEDEAAPDASPEWGFTHPTPYLGRLDRFTDDARRLLAGGARIVVVSRHSKRLAEVLHDADLPASTGQDVDSLPPPGTITLVHQSLRDGWAWPGPDGRPETVLLTDADLFGTVKQRRAPKKNPVRRGITLSDLQVGGYVVHVDHGIGRFRGTKTMEGAEGGREVLVIEYGAGDTLYVPLEHLDRVSPYVAPGDQEPTLSRLGGTEWQKTKEKVKAAAKEMVGELLQLYAKRELASREPYGPDSAWQRELEDSFPYEETPDQAEAIEQVKADMERERPMDRLVCGDVGFGKTEVALRAAFKAVGDGKQVAILVPTTVLAQQHYATFSERLAPYPVRVEVLSRFRSDREIEGVLAGLSDGSVDIVIGTHRLLQKDVSFKDLGLVVIDEEQRFGVSHKEKLKQMRAEVDVLTLSATPIPRTLYMAMAGIRDMSAVNTPPDERVPVKTYLAEPTDDVIKEAILREIERGGQVFYLHNRVSDIHEVAGRVKKLVPQARVAVGHGQMAEGDLEEVMNVFSRGDADVLVATTIIESGIDIPNANTLIADRADRLGLTQLYHLRGRVGRSSQRAYAYLLVPKGRHLRDIARQRLKAVLEANAPGSGFRIAMRDLEIRGAGNLLGAEQSGQIAAVGFDLYTRLLDEAVREARAHQGQVPAAVEEPPAPPRIDLPVEASIPETYIPHLPARLNMYKRMAAVRTIREMKELEQELRDRFGPAPAEVEDLLYVARVRVLADAADVESVVGDRAQVTLKLRHAAGSARVPLEKALGSLTRVGNEQVRIDTARMGSGWRTGVEVVLDRLRQFQAKVHALASQAPAATDGQGASGGSGTAPRAAVPEQASVPPPASRPSQAGPAPSRAQPWRPGTTRYVPRRRG